MWDKRAALVRVKDGDTLVATLDQGFRDTKEIDVRLFGVWAPEMSEAHGEACKQFVIEWFAALPLTKWPFVVTTMRMKQTDREQTTLDRYVGVVTSLDGTRNLNLDAAQFIEGLP